MGNGLVVRDAHVPAQRSQIKRPLAYTLLAALDKEIREDNTSRREQLAEMVVSAAVNGYIEFPESRSADGTVLPTRRVVIDDPDTWLNLVKWLHNHIDGPAMSSADVKDSHTVVRVVFGDSPAFRRPEEDYVEVG